MKRSFFTVCVLAGFSATAAGALLPPPAAIDQTVTPNIARAGRWATKEKDVTPQSDPSFRIWVYEGVCPNRAAPNGNWASWRQSSMDYLYNRSEQWDQIAPDKFHVATMGAWSMLCVDPSAQTSMWMGKLTPGGTNYGNGIEFATIIVSTNPFALSQVRITMRSWDPPYNSLGFVPALTNYSLECQGVRYGPSGAPGPDEIMITGGPADQPVNEVRYVGSRLAYAAHDQAGIDYIHAYVGSITNFGLSCGVQVIRDGVVVADKLRDLPFYPMPAVIYGIVAEGGKIWLTGNGVPNQLYWLESAPSINSANWVFEGIMEAGAMEDKENAVPAGALSRVYRISQRPD